MKNLSDRSLRIQLACLAILGLFIVLTGAAYLSGREMNRSSELITTDAVPGTISAHSIRVAMARCVGWSIMAGSATTPQYRDTSLKLAHAADVEFAAAVKQYESTIFINPGEDRELLARVTTAYAEFNRQRLAYEALIQAGDRAGSAAFLEKNLVPAYLATIKPVDELVQYNHTNSIGYANYIRDSVHRLFWTAAVVLVLAFICVAVLIFNFANRRREIIELGESEEKFSKAFRANPVGIAISEMETGRYIEVNESFGRIVGYSPQEMIGKTSLEQGTWNSAGERNQMIQSMSLGKTLRDFETHIRTHDGGDKTVLINAETIELGGRRCLVALVQDITERKRSTEQLEMLKISVDKHFDAAYWMDINNRFVYVNDTVEESLGYTREELLGQPVTKVAPNATPQGLEEVWKHLRKTGFFNRESIHRRKDGSEFPVEIVASYIRFEGKEFNCGFARDITERKRAEAELIWKTALLEAQLNSTLDGVLVVDPGGRRILQNQRFLKLFKVPEEIARNSDDSPMLQHALSQIRNPEPFRERVAYLYAHPDEIGRDEIELLDGRVFDRYSSPVRDKVGKYFGRIWSFRDITERRQAEKQLHKGNEALRESEQRLRLALGAGQIGVWHQDLPAGAFVVDAMLFDLFAVPLNESRVMSFETFLSRVPVEDQGRVGEDLNSLWAGVANTKTEFRVVRPDGSIRQVVGNGLSVKDEGGKVKRVVGIAIDVTERKQAEKEREILVHDLGERVKELRLLHETARLLQRDYPTVLDLFNEWVLLVPSAWQYPECCEVRVVYCGIEAKTPGWSDSPWKLSVPIESSDGVGRIEVVYLEDSPGATEGPFLAEERTLLDSLAEMLVGYLELRKHQKNLESLVLSRTKDLSRAKEEAEKANDAKGRFLANISHEIRTPMNAILGYAQLMENNPAMPDRVRRKAGIIRTSGDHLLQLVNDVLETSRIEAGKVQLVLDSFDLLEMLEEIRQMFLPLVAAKGNELVFEIDSDLPGGLYGDVGKVRQVVINLLSNAVKFTQAGKIHVKAEARTPDPDRFAVTIRVSDSGRGIPADDLERIFVAFEQTGSGLRAGGTGLGLTISRNFSG